MPAPNTFPAVRPRAARVSHRSNSLPASVVSAGLIALIVAAPASTRAESPGAGPALTARQELPDRPAPGDHSAESLRRFQQTFVARYGGHDRDVPLDIKAEHFEWLLERYLWAPWNVVHHTVILPAAPDGEREFAFGDDVSTWNGALLAALSYKYAVTHDPETLGRIDRLLRGLHFLQTVTGQPGLIARCALRRDTPLHTATLRYVAPDGAVYHVRSDAAKGTYNQVVGGYAVMMLLAYDDLPPETQALARQDLQDLVHHLVNHDYHLTERGGRRTTYGDLTPLVATVVCRSMPRWPMPLCPPDITFPAMIRRRRSAFAGLLSGSGRDTMCITSRR